jgi:predicted Zn-dependent peptidase
MFKLSKLENGLRVATAQMPHMSSVSVGIWVNVGGRYEPAEINGAAHFIEHVLFKGTKRRTAREISQAIEGVGGYLNAFTTEEHTCFYSKAHHDRLEELVDVLIDMFLNSLFAPEEIEKERNVIKEELAMYNDQPQQYVHDLLNETLWPDHPLGRSLTGSEQTLDRMDRGALLNFHRANYLTNNTVIVAAGRVSHQEVLKLVKKYASRFHRGSTPTFLPASVQQRGPSVKVHTKTVEQTQLALGIRACSRHDPRRFALRILNTVLGENMSSRLFQKVREEHGLAYSICSHLNFYEDVGTLTISAGVETENLRKAMALITDELRAMRDSLITQAELRRARDYLVGQLDLSLENTENQMMWVGEQLLGYGQFISPDQIKSHLLEVKPSQVRQVAQDFFRPTQMNLALISPLKEQDSSIRSLNLARV